LLMDVGAGNGADYGFLDINNGQSGSSLRRWVISHKYDVLRLSFGYYNGSSWSEPMSISPAGNIGIGTASPSYKIHVTGGAYCNGTTWINASDLRLKRDIRTMEQYGLKQVMQLKPVTYYFKSDKTNRQEVGFVAQDVMKIVPEVVSGKEGDLSKGETLGLSYGNLVPVLTRAIQEQQRNLEKLENKKMSKEQSIICSNNR
jgi:hypothetical protein